MTVFWPFDQHDSFPGARSLTGLGRRALGAARRAQVSENSCNCTDSFARSFVPHRRVISRDSDLHALGVSISSSSDLACVSVSRLSGELSASCSRFGRALVCESVRRMHVNQLLVLGVIILIIIRGNTDTNLLEEERR